MKQLPKSLAEMDAIFDRTDPPVTYAELRTLYTLAKLYIACDGYLQDQLSLVINQLCFNIGNDYY
jgi:hypothetical protein